MALPQRIAAVPGFIPKNLKDAAPGHRFQLYLEYWQGTNGNAFEPYKKSRPQGKDERAVFDRECAGVLRDLCALPPSSQNVLKGIRARQQALCAHHGANAFRISTTSTAPFATGLGNEHPIENGFAFLTPYGLPYLAGSGVKGILRRAMQELSDDGVDGFTSEAIDTLFGPEIINQPQDAQRGALDFWDVFPSPAGGKLTVEIMTPHYGGYYQKDETPHDSGAPVPVSFLAVPAKSDFDFHVISNPYRLPESLRSSWRDLLDTAFKHACEWVGFGAKTSVGYGAMNSPSSAPVRSASPTATDSAATVAAAPSTIWTNATLLHNAGTGEITASCNGQSTAGVRGADADALRTALGAELAERLKKKRELKGVTVEVEAVGNGWKFSRLA